MDDRQIDKWLRRRFSLVGWVLLSYFAVMFLLANVTVVLDELRWLLRGELADWDAIIGNGWGYILTVAVGLTVLHSWKGPDYWKEQIFRREAPMRAGTFFAMALLMLGAQLLNSLWVTALELMANLLGSSLMPMLEQVSGASDTFSMFLYAGILAPIAEEILFRGYVLRTLRPFGKRFAILGSAFLFGIFHGNLLQAPFAFLVGLILGYVAAEYSAWWAIGLHLFNNLLMADLLTRLLMVLPEPVAAMLDYGLLLAAALGVVVLLALKRRDIRAWRAGEWMDRRCVKCFFTSPGILALTALMALMMVTMFL